MAKEHKKLYKAGKNWVVATLIATTITLCWAGSVPIQLMPIQQSRIRNLFKRKAPINPHKTTTQTIQLF